MKKLLDITFRYKLLHLLFWVVKYILLFHELSINRPSRHLLNILDSVNVTVFQLAVVYFTLSFLIPRYYSSERYFRFAGFTILSVLLSTLLTVLNAIVYVKLLINPHLHLHFIFVFITYCGHLIDASIILALFIAADLAYRYYRKEQQLKQIEKERLETEINFLKAQINPHFLFNALNSIYVLMKEDLKLSEQTLLKFSALLRYQLYDCSNNETSLAKEIEFLKNYIDLEKIRNSENRRISFDVTVTEPYTPIAPFILIPFVENAFKHLSHFSNQDNTIQINLQLHGPQFNFEVINTCETNAEEIDTTHNGIGLQNVKRRLALLYPKRHHLQLMKEGNLYLAKLTLQLYEN